MAHHIFVTGALGFLGKFFVRDLLEHEPDARLYLLVRGKRDQSPQDRIQAEGLAHDRIIPVPGDITDDDLTDHAATLPPMDEFWHIAGLTAFNESRRPQLFAVNVEGTRNALALAERLQTKRFFHISTAYVAGICDGPVMEDELLPNPVFRNPYEETKYEGEKLVRASSLPWIIIRPSIIMGHSKTGEVDSDKMVYGVARCYHSLASWVNRDFRDRGGRPTDLHYCVTGDVRTEKNLVCVDDVVRLMLLTRERGQPRRTYHATHAEPTTIGELHEIITRNVDARYLEMLLLSEAQPEPKQKFIDRGTRIYRPYMTGQEPRFDRRNVENLDGWRPVSMDSTRINSLIRCYTEALGKQEREKARRLDTSLDLSRLPDLKEYGNFTIAYETMSRQVQAFRVPGVHGYVAYAVAENTAMVVGDPVSDQPEPLLRAFLEWAAGQNLNPCALQVHERTAIVLRELGLAVNKMGIETFMDLVAHDPALRGGRYARTREMRNIASRFGATITERPIDLINPAEVMRVSNAWMMAKKNKNELRLLLREISIVPEPGMRYVFLRHDKIILAYVFFAPMYEAGETVGYYATVERFDFGQFEAPGRFNAMHHIACEFAPIAKAEGAQRIALGMSPLHDVEKSEFNDNPVLTSLFKRLYEESELYAFQGIARHKRGYPNRIEEPVFFATIPDATEESVLDIFRGVGFLDA